MRRATKIRLATWWNLPAIGSYFIGMTRRREKLDDHNRDARWRYNRSLIKKEDKTRPDFKYHPEAEAKWLATAVKRKENRDAAVEKWGAENDRHTTINDRLKTSAWALGKTLLSSLLIVQGANLYNNLRDPDFRSAYSSPDFVVTVVESTKSLPTMWYHQESLVEGEKHVRVSLARLFAESLVPAALLLDLNVGEKKLPTEYQTPINLFGDQGSSFDDMGKRTVVGSEEAHLRCVDVLDTFPQNSNDLSYQQIVFNGKKLSPKYATEQELLCDDAFDKRIDNIVAEYEASQ